MGENQSKEEISSEENNHEEDILLDYDIIEVDEEVEKVKLNKSVQEDIIIPIEDEKQFFEPSADEEAIDADRFYDELKNYFSSPIDDSIYEQKKIQFANLLQSEAVSKLKGINFEGKSWLHHAIDLSIEKEQCTNFFIRMLEYNFSTSLRDESEQTTPLIYVAKKFLDLEEKKRTEGTQRYEKPKIRELNRNTKYLRLHKGFLLYLLSKKNEDIGINCRDSSNSTALHYLLNAGHAEPVKKLLLRNDLDLWSSVDEESTILQYAVTCCKDKGVIESLIQLQSEWINTVNDHKRTALHISLEHNNDKATNILLSQKNIDCNIQDLDGKTPLHMFCGGQPKGRSNLLKQFLSNESIDVNIIDGNGKTALHHLCKNGSKDLIQSFLDEKRNVINFNTIDETGKTALFYSRGNGEILEYLLRENVFDVTIQDNHKRTILHYYSGLSSCNSDIVDLILKCCDEYLLFVKDKDGNQPLDIAKNSNNAKLYKILTPKVLQVFKCIESKSFLDVKKLLDEIDCSKCICPETSKCVLHTAAKRCQKTDEDDLLIVKHVLERTDSDLINHTDTEGNTPLHLLAELKSISEDSLNLFFSVKGINVNLTNQEKKTPLHCAFESGNHVVIVHLIKRNDLDFLIRDTDQKCYLHFLCSNIIKHSTYILYHFLDILKKKDSIRDPSLGCIDQADSASSSSKMAFWTDHKGCTPLYDAVVNCHDQAFLSNLLEQCYDIEDVITKQCGPHKRSVLMQAILIHKNESAVSPNFECSLKFLEKRNQTFDDKKWARDDEGRNILHYCFENNLSFEIIEDVAALMSPKTWKMFLLSDDNNRKKPLDCLDYKSERLFHLVEKRLLDGEELKVTSLKRSDVSDLEFGMETEDGWARLLDYLMADHESSKKQMFKERINNPEFMDVGKTLLTQICILRRNTTLQDLHDTARDLGRDDVVKCIDSGLSRKYIDLDEIEKDEICFCLGKQIRNIKTADPNVFLEKFIKRFDLPESKIILKPTDTRYTKTRSLFLLLESYIPSLSLQKIYMGLVESMLNSTAESLKKIINAKFFDIGQNQD